MKKKIAPLRDWQLEVDQGATLKLADGPDVGIPGVGLGPDPTDATVLRDEDIYVYAAGPYTTACLVDAGWATFVKGVEERYGNTIELWEAREA
jgi:hypothetical protein